MNPTKGSAKRTKSKSVPPREPGHRSSNVEGEGSYSATRRYNADLAKALETGRVDELARKAKKAIEGPERASLERAEQIGKARRKD